MSQEQNCCVEIASQQEAIQVATARGSWLTDHAGRTYLDFVQGYAVNTLGHAPDTLHASLAREARRLLYSGTHPDHAPIRELATRLARHADMARVAFTAGEGEANEMAIRFARQWGEKRGRNRIISTRFSFPGRGEVDCPSNGAPLGSASGMVKVPHNDLAAIETAISRQSVAVLVEPIDGELGLSLPSRFYLRGLRKLTQEHGLLLIVDETRCGIGRSGRLFSHQDDGIVPDILTLARGLAGGLPLAATLIQSEIGLTAQPESGTMVGSSHSLSMHAALATLDALAAPGFLNEVQASGAYLHKRLESLAVLQRLGEVRGMGLLQAIKIPDGTAQDIARCALREGLLVDSPRPTWLRLMPALNVTLAEIDEMLVRLAAAILRSRARGA